jgi:hypothetical protein
MDTKPTVIRPTGRFTTTPRASKLAAAVSLYLECLRAAEREEGDIVDDVAAEIAREIRGELAALLGVDEFEIVRDSRGIAIALRTLGLTLSA